MRFFAPTRQSSDLAPPTGWRLFAVFVAGFTLCILPLGVASSPNPNSVLSAVSPFGWHELIVVQVLAALPLAFFLAQRIAGGFGPERARSGAAGCAAAGIGLAALVLYGWPGDLWRNWGFGGRLLLRTGFCTVLAAAWMSAVLLLDRPAAGRPRSVRRDRQPNKQASLPWPAAMAQAVLLLLIAAGLPAAFLGHFAQEQAGAAQQAFAAGRWWKSWTVMESLADAGCDVPIGGVPLAVAREDLSAHIRAEIEALENAPSQTLSNAERIERARRLAALASFDEAREALGGLAQESIDGALLSAAIANDERDWDMCRRDCERALLMIERQAPAAESAARGASSPVTPGELADQAMRAYEGLAAAQSKLGDHAAAESTWRRAIAALPQHAAMLHWQLANHLAQGGRPFQASNEFEIAADLDPALKTLISNQRGRREMVLPTCWTNPFGTTARSRSASAAGQLNKNGERGSLNPNQELAVR